MSTGTRDRIVRTSAELFRTQGYTATGVKQIVTAAQAPFGSLYHFFPGGKEQLGAEAIRASGELYAQLIPAVFDPAPDVVTGVRDFFAGAAAHLVETNYADACPIATVALEVSSSSETMRQACAEVFESWITAGAERFTDAGVDEPTARELAIGMLGVLEGAFVLARATRTTEPLRVAGELAAQRVEAALREGPANAGPAPSPASEAAPRAPEPTSAAPQTTSRAPEPTPAAPQPTPRPSEPAPSEPGPTVTAARVRPRLRARWPAPGAGRSPGPASP
jgi:AcrR family transcriptional regulator